MFARPPFLFGGCQFDLFERTAFLFVSRSNTKFISSEDLEACQIIDLELTACELPDVGLNAEPATDLALCAVLGIPEFVAVPGTDCPVGARPIGDLNLRAVSKPDEALAALDLSSLTLEAARLLDCDLDALLLPTDIDLDAEVPDVGLDAEVTNSEDCC